MAYIHGTRVQNTTFSIIPFLIILAMESLFTMKIIHERQCQFKFELHIDCINPMIFSSKQFLHVGIILKSNNSRETNIIHLSINNYILDYVIQGPHKQSRCSPQLVRINKSFIFSFTPSCKCGLDNIYNI